MAHPTGTLPAPAPAAASVASRPTPASSSSSAEGSGRAAAAIEPLPMIKLMGVELHAVAERDAIGHILDQLAIGHGGVTVTPNLDHLRRCRHDMEFASLVAEAELVVADGMPLIWASRIAGCGLPGRIAGSDLILTLSAAAATAGRSIFLLGGAPGTAEGAAAVLNARHPDLKIVGTYCPPVGFEQNETELARVVAALTAAKPDIVFVALGSPKQERLIERIRTTLPRAWWLGVGVSFSFLTGHVQRAPRWVQVIGMEWVHRLVQEPQRLFKRYVMQGLPFAAALFYSAAVQRLSGVLTGQPPRCHARQNRSSRGTALLAAQPTAQAEEVEEALASLASTLPSTTGIRGTREAGNGATLRRIKAVVLLGGQLRPSPLMQAAGRCVLDLPVTEGRTLLDHWLVDVAALAARAGLESLPTRVLVNRAQDRPTPSVPSPMPVSIEMDASELRGTGGVLCDITRDYADDDYVLVANASQLLLEPLPALAAALENKRADIALVSHLDGTPSGLTLIRCATLRKVKPIGFIDLKEQALAAIAKEFDVRVVHCTRPTAMPLRTTPDYIAALGRYHRGLGRLPGSRRGLADPSSDLAGKGFAIVEPGATVHAESYLHDSVVLRGARIEQGATVVRSLVGANATLHRDAAVMDGRAA